MNHRLFAVIAAFAATAPSAMLAQTVTGAVRGTVTDASGAIIVGAKVTATNGATGVAVSAVTDSAGQYSIRFLQIGQYKLTVDANGFKPANYGPFALEIDQTANINVPLAVSGEATVIQVNDEAPILQTENPTLGETFTENTINSVPLNGRDFSQLTVFTPGAVSTNYGAYGGQNSIERSTGSDNEPNVNGNRQQSNNYSLDGQEINENLNNTIGYNPSPDSLEQIRVIAANANAEFGNVNGGDVVMVMKSGSNKLHGSVFGFLENYNLDANSWTNKHASTVTPINPFTQTIFGATLGGPIVKDKLFFFVDYEGARQHTGGLATTHVAPAALRTGDFSSYLRLHGIQLYNTQVAGGPVAYANNQIPITNPVALYLFAHPEVYPLPNIEGASDDPEDASDNYRGVTKSYQRNDQGDVKIDLHFHKDDVLSARYSQGLAQDATTAVPVAVQFPGSSDYPDHLFTVNYIHNFSSSIINDLRASYARIRFNSGVSTDPSNIFGYNGNSVVGIPSPAQQTAGFSAQNFSNGNLSGFGVNPTPEVFIDNVFQYSDDLTWQKNRNLFKFGVQITRYQQNSFYPGNNGELGYFQYSGQFTAYPGAAQDVAFADFVSNNVYEAAVGQVVGRTGQRQYRDAYYAQDDIKVNERLTLNLGIRYEYDQPIYEVNNKQANLNLQTGAILYAGVNGNSRALYNSTYDNVMPRIGFAYQVSPRLVVRGGYGITNYLEGTGANLRLTQNPPFHNDFDSIATIPTFTDGTYSAGTPLKASNGFPTTTPPVTTFYAWRSDFQPSSIQEQSLTLQYAVSPTTSVQVGYVGEQGHHLTDPVYANQLASPTSTAPYASVVGQGGVVKVTDSESAMNYQALQAVLRQHLKAGFEFTANYSYGKSLTDDIGYYGTSNTNQQYYQQNAFDLRDEWGPSGSDVRHAFSATGTYTIPFGRGQRFGAKTNLILDEIAGGWKLSGSSVAYSGFPVTLTSAANYSNLVFAYTGAARPDQVQPMHPVGTRTIDNWFGSSVVPCSLDANGNALLTDNCNFAPQSSTHFGNVRPSTLRAPGFLNFDFALQKSFRLFEDHRIDFRADGFNALNIASYGNPDNGLNDPNLGQISSTRSTERHIQLELKYAF